MPDSRRTWAALAALYADNTAGAISPQDLRDGFASIKPHVASDAPTASDDETLGFDTGHAWIDTSTSPSSVYECLDASTGAAVWAKVYPPEAPSVDAEDVAYGNGTSGLAAEDVQAAIDELAGGLGVVAGVAGTALQPGDELTALAATGVPAGHVPKADGAGNIAWGAESGGGGPVAAEDVTYDNGTSGLTAEDVQNAIDEVYAAVVAGGIPAASGIVIARHGDDPDFPDPNTGGVTYWLGSAAPNNRKVGDLWLETDAFDGGS